MNRFIELDHAGQTTVKSTEVDTLLDVGAKDTPVWDSSDLTRESVVAGCREVTADQVEIVVSHSVYGSLTGNFDKDELERVLKNDPKQMQSRISVIHRAEGWKIELSTVYTPHISVETARARTH